MWVTVSENKCLNFFKMFLNCFALIKRQKRKTKIVNVKTTSKVVSQGSSTMLSYWSRINKKLNKLKLERRISSITRGQVIKNLVYIKTKKTYLSMSLGPIAKKKKSLTTLGFLQKTYRLNSKLLVNKDLITNNRYIPYLCKLQNNYKTTSVKFVLSYRTIVL